MKNPYLNALLAAAYIGVVGTFMNLVPEHFNPEPKILGNIAFISLVTLSVAMMGYFFAFKPLQMYIDGDKENAVNSF